MPLPDPIRRFWYAYEALNASCTRTDWGVIVTDVRYPTIYDANHANVLEPAPGLELAEVRAALHPAVRALGIPYEHIEVMDADARTPAVRSLLASAPPRFELDVVMAFEAPGPPAGNGLGAHEVTDLDDAFWAAERRILDAFGEELSGTVGDELTRRSTEVYVPAGLRFFAVERGGTPVSMAALISLEGVGYIDNVATLPEHRRRGFAEAVTAAALRASVEGGDRLTFLVAEESGRARRIYERMGFAVRGRAAGFTRPLPPADPPRAAPARATGDR